MNDNPKNNKLKHGTQQTVSPEEAKPQNAQTNCNQQHNPIPFFIEQHSHNRISPFSSFLQWNPLESSQQEQQTPYSFQPTHYNEPFQEPTQQHPNLSKDFSRDEVTEKKKEKKNVLREDHPPLATSIKKRKRKESDQERENGKALIAFSKRKASLLKKVNLFLLQQLFFFNLFFYFFIH